MEFGLRELMTFGIVLVGIATTWGVLKATIKSITSILEDTKESLAEMSQRLDHLEANQAVSQSSIETMANDILSPQILKERSERDGATEIRLRILENEIERIYKMHNGSHPSL